MGDDSTGHAVDRSCCHVTSRCPRRNFHHPWRTAALMVKNVFKKPSSRPHEDRWNVTSGFETADRATPMRALSAATRYTVLVRARSARDTADRAKNTGARKRTPLCEKRKKENNPYRRGFRRCRCRQRARKVRLVIRDCLRNSLSRLVPGCSEQHASSAKTQR